MSLTLVSAPIVQPVSEAEAWAHLRLNLAQFGVEPADRAKVSGLLDAAVSHFDARDGVLGRCLVPQTWDYTLDAFPADSICLPLAPLMSISSVTYVDLAGATQTFSASLYSLSADRHWTPRIDLVYGAEWPSTRVQPDAVTVRFEAGYDSGNSPQDASAVPEPIKTAIKFQLELLYDREPNNRETLERARDALILPYRRTW